MLVAHLLEEFCGRAAFAAAKLLEALTDTFSRVGMGGDVEQSLILCGTLKNGFGLAIDGKDDGAAGLLEPLHELDGVVAEGGEGLDVFGDVDLRCHLGASA